jgi:hypothetical protein
MICHSLIAWLGHMFLAKRTPALFLAGLVTLAFQFVGWLHRDQT